MVLSGFDPPSGDSLATYCRDTMEDKTHTVSESADKIRVDTKVKRGTGTRDQDEIKVQVKGDEPEEVVTQLNETVELLESTAETLRNQQPNEE